MYIVGGGGGGGAPRAVVATHVNEGGAAKQVSYSVDLEQIPGLIAKYEEARERLHKILNKATEIERLGDNVSPGSDEVSRNSTKTLTGKAGEGQGGLAWSVRDAIDRISSQIDQLKAARTQYANSEDAARAEMPTYEV